MRERSAIHIAFAELPTAATTPKTVKVTRLITSAYSMRAAPRRSDQILDPHTTHARQEPPAPLPVARSCVPWVQHTKDCFCPEADLFCKRSFVLLPISAHRGRRWPGVPCGLLKAARRPEHRIAGGVGGKEAAPPAPMEAYRLQCRETSDLRPQICYRGNIVFSLIGARKRDAVAWGPARSGCCVGAVRSPPPQRRPSNR